MSMDDVTAFVKARLDEDVAALGYVEPGPWTSSGPYVGSAAGIIAQARHTETGAHIARHDPARVLREVAAKRAILAEHTSFVPDIGWNKGERRCTCCGAGHDDVYLTVSWPCDTLKAVAAVWSDHPDYRQEWAL